MKDSARIVFGAMIAAILACAPARAQVSGPVAAESQVDPGRRPFPEVVAPSSLTRLEIVDRILETIISGNMNQPAVQRMFGISEEHSRLGRAVRILGYRDRPDNLPARFVYHLIGCDSAQLLVPTLRCAGADMQRLHLMFLFEDSRAGGNDPNRCLFTRDVSARLAASGWRFTIAPETLDNLPVRERYNLPSDTLTKDGTYVLLWPHDRWGEGECLVILEVYAPAEGD